MLDHIEEVIALARGRQRVDLDSDRLFYLAVLKLVEIVGEASTRVSEPFRISHPEVPWREIVGTRNRLIHGYDAVDRDILWTIAIDDFPALAARIKSMLSRIHADRGGRS